MEREQFTFYASFASAIGRIRKASDRCAAYDAVCAYALSGQLPDLDALPESVAIVFDLIRPVLDTAARKSKGGKKTGRPKEDNGKTSGRCEEDNGKTSGRPKEDNGKEKEGEKEKEKEKEVEVEREVENECYLPPVVPLAESEPADALVEAFNEFWSAYPKKVGKKEAQKAFAKVPKAEWPKLVPAVEAQKNSKQWQKDDGQYIPHPTTWLNQGRWEDSVEPNKSAYARMYDPPVKLGELDQLLEQI